jgi:hypothetical protein
LTEIQEIPDILEKMLPTLKEIHEALESDRKIPNRKYIKWGKTLVRIKRPFFR